MPDRKPALPQRTVGCALALVAALAASQAAAADPDLDTQCLDCHRPQQSRGDVPVIEGQQRAYLRNQLTRFRDRHREQFPMSALVAGFDDTAVDQFAHALSRRPWRSATDPVDREAAARGRVRAEELACASCHGAGYDGVGDIPRLAGQQRGYLRRQLEAFGDGMRYHPPSGAGVRLYVLSAQDKDALADFLRGLGADAAPAR